VAVKSDRLGAESASAVVAAWAVGPGVLRGQGSAPVSACARRHCRPSGSQVAV